MEETEYSNIVEYPTIDNLNIDINDQDKYINKRLDYIIKGKNAILKGNTYEEYVKNYIIDNERIECWLWKDIPKDILLDSKLVSNESYDQILEAIKSNSVKDISYYKYVYKKDHINPYFDFGVDILAKKSNEYIFIQCKNTKYLSTCNLKSFYNVMNKYSNDKGRIYYSGICIIKNKLTNVNYINLNLDPSNIKDKIISDINTDSKLLTKIKNEYIQKKYKENMNKYIEYRKNINESICEYGYAKWTYLLNELNDYIVLNKQLPENNNKIIYKFVNYNNNNVHEFTSEWNEFKEQYLDIFNNMI